MPSTTCSKERNQVCPRNIQSRKKHMGSTLPPRTAAVHSSSSTENGLCGINMASACEIWRDPSSSSNQQTCHGTTAGNESDCWMLPYNSSSRTRDRNSTRASTHQTAKQDLKDLHENANPPRKTSSDNMGRSGHQKKTQTSHLRFKPRISRTKLPTVHKCDHGKDSSLYTTAMVDTKHSRHNSWEQEGSKEIPR